MNVTTLIEWSLTTGDVLRHEYHDYSGTWELCKGDDAAATQMQRANDLQQQALDTQKKQMDLVNKSLSDYLNKSTGFDPKFLKATISQFMDTNASSFNDASKTLQGMLSSRGQGGGDLPTGGSFTRANSSLLGQEASSTAGGLRDINMANLQQMLTNRFNAASISAGLPAVMNGPIGTFGSMGSNALGQYIAAKNSGFGAQMGNYGALALAGGAGSVLGQIPKVLNNVAPNVFG